jgi:hypothetical protein
MWSGFAARPSYQNTVSRYAQSYMSVGEPETARPVLLRGARNVDCPVVYDDHGGADGKAPWAKLQHLSRADRGRAAAVGNHSSSS